MGCLHISVAKLCKIDGSAKTVALFWFTNFCSKIKASYFLQTLAWLNPILTKLAHRCSTHRCVHTPWQVKWANLHCCYQSLFGLLLVHSNFLYTSCMFYLVGCGKGVGQTHTLKVEGIKLTLLQIKVTLLVQQKRTHLPMQETRLDFLSGEDPLDEEMATHSSIHAREIPQTE